MVEWTDEKVRRLFLVILAVHKIKVNADEVAAAFGEGVTAVAISQNLSKLRKDALKINGEESAAGGVAFSSTRRRNQRVQDGGVTKKAAAGKKKIVMDPEEPYEYYEE